jgi:hypothetical protein
MDEGTRRGSSSAVPGCFPLFNPMYQYMIRGRMQ